MFAKTNLAIYTIILLCSNYVYIGIKLTTKLSATVVPALDILCCIDGIGFRIFIELLL